jgi:hypothetical protein
VGIALADALRVSRRTVYRWESGVNPISAGIPNDLAELLRAHGAKLAKEAARLDRAA